MGDRDGVVMVPASLEVIGEPHRVDRLAPLGFELVGFEAELVRDGEPALGKRAACRDEDRARDRVEERAFHQTGSRAGGEERELLGPKEALEAWRDASEEVAKLRAAVADHRPHHLLEDLAADPRRPGDEESRLLAHPCSSMR